jgi:chromosome segregation ATPase
MNDTPETDAETMQDEMDHVDSDIGPFAPSNTVCADFARKLERERDEAIDKYQSLQKTFEEWQLKFLSEQAELLHNKDVERDKLFDEAYQIRIERDEARSKLSLNQQTLTIAEGTLSDLRKQRDEWSAMCSRYKQERDIAEQDATNYHARIIELIAERDKTKQERDEAREKYDQICSQTLIEINKVCDERDKLREALRDVLKVSEPTPVMTYQKMEDIASKALKDTAK